MIFEDRISAYPNRYAITDENGNTSYVFLERADDPITVGTPLNAETFNAMQKEAAPAGFGLGETSPAVAKWSEIDSLTKSGWYRFAEKDNVIKLGDNFNPSLVYANAYMRVDAYSETTATQYLYPNTINRLLFIRHKRNAVDDVAAWGEWVLDNPPMVYNEVYRTTEKIQNKYIYKKRDSNGDVWYNTDGGDSWQPYASAIGAASTGNFSELAHQINTVSDDLLATKTGFTNQVNKVSDDLLTTKASISDYGLGNPAVADWSSVDELTNTGWYRFRVEDSSIVVCDNSYNAAYMRVDAYSQSNATQILYPNTNTYVTFVRYKRGWDIANWSEWACINPPMASGAEYLTTERYLGKPVYTKVVECGKMPNTETKIVAHEASVVQIVRYSGQNVTNGTPIPRVYNGREVHVFIDRGNIYITTTADYSDQTACVQLWYTKS
jgi:hypothetical protein